MTTCDSCRFYDGAAALKPKSAGMGLCKIGRPLASVIPTAQGLTRLALWPPVAPDEGACGEYHPRLAN